MKLTFLNTNLFKKTASLGLTLAMLGTPQIGKGEEHVVKKGDTLTEISQMYYGTITFYDELARYNGIENPNMIRVGQVIEIPDRKYLYDILDYYEVQRGDTLWKISKMYYDDYNYWRILGEYNGITNQYALRTGTVLTIPNTWVLDDYHNQYECNDEELYQETITYTFQANDTLWKICKNYYGSGTYAYALARYNNIENVYAIRNGTKLLLPPVDILNYYLEDNNEEIIYGLSLDRISNKYYGTKDYAYLLSLINGIDQCGPYHEEDLIIPKLEYLDNYLEILNNLEPEDSLSNYYIVEKGDTLTKISIKKYGTDEYVNFLKSINEIENPRNLQINTVLYVPKMTRENNKKLVK